MTAFLWTVVVINTLGALCTLFLLTRHDTDQRGAKAIHLIVAMGLSIWGSSLLLGL